MLLCSNAQGGGLRVFSSASRAARSLGVSQQAVSLAVQSGGLCRGMRFRYVPRIYVVKAGGVYKVVVRDGGGWKELGGGRVVGPIGKGIVDITEQMWCMARDL